ncbi:MAG: serine hydrolase domain-containing protein [Bacteroidota bacterium]
MSRYASYDLFSGTVLVADSGSLVYEKSFGLANEELGVRHTPNMRFVLGSITKQFTAVLVLQLVEDGKIQLNDPVNKYLTNYPNPRGSDITIHHLLSHSSGLQHWNGVDNFLMEEARNHFEKDSIMVLFTQLPERNEPGESFQYSSIGYYLLGMILENVTGEEYGELLQEQIFVPLGMNSSLYTETDEIVPNRVSPYRYNFLKAEYENAEYRDPSTTFSTGGIISTAEDLLKWDQALYSTQLLSEEYLNLLFAPNFDRYGYGFHVNLRGEHADLNIRWHGGLVTGYRTQITRLIDENKTIILLSNHRDTDTYDITNKILSAYQSADYELPKRSLFKLILEKTAHYSAKEAVLTVDSLLSVNSNDYDLNEVNIARAALELKSDGAYQNSAELMIAIIDLFPETAYRTILEYQISDTYSILKDGAKAIEYAKRVLEANPNHEGAQLIMNRWNDI